MAADGARQQEVATWLAARLGIHEAVVPSRLTRVVEAFEAQAGIEQKAENLDYDDSGRLNFSPDAGGQADVVLRMSDMRRRHYGERHVAARVRQVDELRGQLAGYVDELEECRRELDAYAAQSLWLHAEFVAQAAARLGESAQILVDLCDRSDAVRAAFLALPRQPADSGVEPASVGHELLEA